MPINTPPSLVASISVTASAQTVDLTNIPPPYTIAITPGASNTSRVEISATANAAANPGSALWHVWAQGDVTVPTVDVFFGKLTALRFTRVSGSNTDTCEVVA